MATNFPGSLDNNSTLPNPAAGDAPTSPHHASQHANANDSIKAMEAKVGTGSSTPVVSTLLFGTGTGTSAWTQLTSAQLAASLSDETGSGLAVFGTSPTLVTPKIDTINESTPGNGTTIGGVNIKSGFMSGANLTAGTVGSSQLATGVPVQMVNSNFTAVATGTTLIPEDDTIPQITEGTEFMTLAITPKSATNHLYIRVKAFLSQSAATNDIIGALFQDATANALAAQDITVNAASGMVNLLIEHDMVSGTTSSTTFRFRAGPVSAATATFNGFAGARKFGGITLSTMQIIEYKV